MTLIIILKQKFQNKREKKIFDATKTKQTVND